MASATQYPPLPADGYAAAWTTWDGDHLDVCALAWENEGWTATGRVAGADVEYIIRLSPLWHVRQFLLFRDLEQPDLWLGTDGRGRWGEINGAHRPELDGALDLALAVTPFTHTLPIRRLGVAVGGSAHVPVVTVDVETLAVELDVVTYRRTAEHTWVATGASGEQRFDVDVHGLPNDVAPTFRRVTPGA